MRRLALAAALGLAAGCSGTTVSTREVERQIERAPGALASQPATTVLKDALILAGVKARLSVADPDSATTLSVRVHEGVVTLGGSVRSAAARTRDAAEARAAAGVSRVVDALRVDPHLPSAAQRVDDVGLATRVTAAIAAQLGFTHISVRVDAGTATLSGTAPSAAAKATALATARGTDGIRNVVDRLGVERP